MIINKNVELDFPCPECGHKRKFKLKDLEKNPSYICESCKKTINIEGRKFVKNLENTMILLNQIMQARYKDHLKK